MAQDAPDDNLARQLEREKALFRYHHALERGDFETVEAILKVAECDPILDGMIQDLNDYLEAAAEQDENVDGAEGESPPVPEATSLRSLALRYGRASREPESAPFVRSLSGYGTGSALRIADLDEWRADPDYSPQVAYLLTQAYGQLDPALQGHSARETIMRFSRALHRTMSRSQRLRVCYVYGLLLTQLGHDRDSLSLIDEACELAYSLRASGALIDLLLLRSKAHHHTLEMREAVEDLRDCLDLLHTTNDAPDTSDIPFEVTVHCQLATGLMYLADFDGVKRHLDSARTLLPSNVAPPMVNATLMWLNAHVQRLRGNSQFALWLADEAAKVYTTSNPTASTARLRIFIAEVSLDCAEALPDGTQRLHTLHQSRRSLEESLRLAATQHDQPATDLATLVSSRHDRLLKNTTQISRIFAILKRAEPTHDIPLLAQGFTALGDEFRYVGAREYAVRYYRNALAALESYDLPFLGIWARRALLGYEEGTIK